MDSFDDDWARIQAAAREEVARTRLNGTESPAGGGGAGAVLEIHEADLATVEDCAATIADVMARSDNSTRNATHLSGTLLSTPGFETGSALLDLVARWETRTEALHRDCVIIEQHLRETYTLNSAADLERAAELQRLNLSPGGRDQRAV
ncbi:hypothetical protein [Streptomyces sp. RFCAC02]|uniref:hypothetical protein n=1 Tax=Streptomyces sp. RFCAC02 TaxID=2499143 RepID=UPI001022665B|nr:hypothetical protein [Streptomyces sp. RFCAC02]